MNQSEIRSKLQEIVELGKSKFPTWSGIIGEVGFVASGVVAGRAWRQSKNLEFNLVLAGRAGSTFIQTIAHEVAHLITFELYPFAKQGHGPEFRWVMDRMGFEGSTYHKYDTAGLKRTYTKVRHVGVCDCGQHMLTTTVFNRIKTGVTYKCRRCSGKIAITNKTQVIKAN